MISNLLNNVFSLFYFSYYSDYLSDVEKDGKDLLHVSLNVKLQGEGGWATLLSGEPIVRFFPNFHGYI